MAAWGAGVDSTAMLIELITRVETVDVALFANTGGERPETYAFIPIFTKWLADRGVPFVEVRYEPKAFKNWPPYRTLEENCLTNGTLPGKGIRLWLLLHEVEDPASEPVGRQLGARPLDLGRTRQGYEAHRV
jgi:hypothetical protein